MMRRFLLAAGLAATATALIALLFCAVIATNGVLKVLNLTTGESPTLPLLSVARTWMVWAPSVSARVEMVSVAVPRHTSSFVFGFTSACHSVSESAGSWYSSKPSSPV